MLSVDGWVGGGVSAADPGRGEEGTELAERHHPSGHLPDGAGP